MMDKNVKITRELVKLAKSLVVDEEYPDMTSDIADENNVVAGAICYYCIYFESDGSNDQGNCKKLKCKTYQMDVCDHYDQVKKNTKRITNAEEYKNGLGRKHKHLNPYNRRNAGDGL